MNRAVTFGTVATAVFFTLACGGGAGGSMGGGNSGNAEACKNYVQAYNDMTCIPDATKLDPATICPDNLDMSPVDMAEYYNCMAENSKCNGDLPDLAGQANCKMPGM